MTGFGRIVVSDPQPVEREAGAVALVHLYGPNGGYNGAQPIDEDGAREVIAALTWAITPKALVRCGSHRAREAMLRISEDCAREVVSA